MLTPAPFKILVSLLGYQILLTQGVVQMSDEKRVINELIGNYSVRGKIGRPVQNHNDTIQIFYGMSLIQILDLDEKNQVLITNVWAKYKWNDVYLRWNESDYGNISVVRVNSGDIWKPDIKLYNYADSRLEERRDAQCVINSNGNVQWTPQAIFKSSCSIDIRYFPFDVQNCHLKFGSWTYDGSKLDLQFLDENVSGFAIDHYVTSNEWAIEKSTGERNVIRYYGTHGLYVDLDFKLVIQRQAAFYSYILILPCVLLSSLTVVLFWLPPESPAKMQLGMNIFVAFFVLLLLLADSTPPAAASIPLIGAFYCLNMVLITLSTLLSVVIVNVYFHGPWTKVPQWFRRLMLDVLAKIFCMQNTLMSQKELEDRRNSIKFTTREESVDGSFGEQTHANGSNVSFTKAGDKSHRDHIVGTGPPSADWKPSSIGLGSESDFTERVIPLPPQYTQLEMEVKEIRKLLKKMWHKSMAEAQTDYLAREWRLVALVLDRLFFFLYTIIVFASAFTLFRTNYFHT